CAGEKPLPHHHPPRRHSTGRPSGTKQQPNPNVPAEYNTRMISAVRVSVATLNAQGDNNHA
ncbi:hypothetical protein UA45_16855, partial [Morganella morganii]